MKYNYWYIPNYTYISGMDIKQIQKISTIYFDRDSTECHESLLRSYQALEKILEMTKRGDSKETILEVGDLLGYGK